MQESTKVITTCNITLDYDFIRALRSGKILFRRTTTNKICIGDIVGIKETWRFDPYTGQVGFLVDDYPDGNLPDSFIASTYRFANTMPSDMIHNYMVAKDVYCIPYNEYMKKLGENAREIPYNRTAWYYDGCPWDRWFRLGNKGMCPKITNGSTEVYIVEFELYKGSKI